MVREFDLSYQAKTLEQFESNPYPHIPIEESPKNNLKLLYESSLVTAFYRRDRRVIEDLSQYSILDLACGTGYTTLILAEANPDAKIVAVDISSKSLKLAEQRLSYHGFNNVEYHLVSLEEIHKLGIKFDYINASDILYFIPNTVSALERLGSVLKPNGIIRGNFHSYYQRFNYYRAQELFTRMGLMAENPGEIEISIVREFFSELKQDTHLQQNTWRSRSKEEVDNETILMNYLIQNDRGFTMPRVVSFLVEANLQLVDMVDWWRWNLNDLFKDVENLPAFLAMGFADLSLEEKLYFYELINPNKRLLDFWCCHADRCLVGKQTGINSEEINWEKIKVYLHPQLKTESFQQEINSVDNLFPVNLHRFFPFLFQEGWLDRIVLNSLFIPLCQSPHTLQELVNRWLYLYPFNSKTLMPSNPEDTASKIAQALVEYEQLGIVLLDSGDES